MDIKLHDDINSARATIVTSFDWVIKKLEDDNKTQHQHILDLRKKIEDLTGKPWFNSFDALTLQKIAPR